MDVHTRYAPDYLVQCLKALQLTGADNVGGPWRAVGRGLVQRTIAMAFNSSFAVGNARSRMLDYEGSVDTVYLGCWRRDRLIEVGLFDEDLVRNQDDELNLRITRAGGTIWQSPAIISWYEPRSSLRQLFRQYAQYGYWKVKVIQKHRLPASVRHLIPAMFVATLVVAALAAPLSPAAATILVASLASYGVAAAVAGAVLCARNSSWSSFPLTLPIFACFHFGYGIGFVAGVWRFWSGRATTNSVFSDLTRT
jgi:cellulose synthase/poly-beta-1,6-N-acetylglucosamine synthase-like glycosyltransferase